MQKVNTLFGKRVLDCRTGNTMATVRDVVLGRGHQRIHSLIIGEGSSVDHDTVVHWNDITGAGEFVVIDGTEQLIPLSQEPEIHELRGAAEQITGKKVISAGGEQVGTVADLYFSADGSIVALEMKQGIFGSGPTLLRAEYVQAIGPDAIISESSQLLTHAQFNGTEDVPLLEEPQIHEQDSAHMDAAEEFTDLERAPLEVEVGHPTDRVADGDTVVVEPPDRPYQP